jgi:hypothetical protein
MTGTEHGERTSSGCPVCEVKSEVCVCPCTDCVAWRAARPCPGCDVLRSLLRLALGKLRDVQRADVTGAVDSLEKALDEVGR